MRVDSGNRIGMGHVTECISLVKSMLKRLNIEVIFLTRNYQPGVEKIRSEGFRVEVIGEEKGLINDSQAVLEFASRFYPSLIIVDLLRVKRADTGAIIIDDTYFKRLRGNDFKLAAIYDDDLQDEISADLAINFHISQKESYYAGLPEKDKYCIGPAYALLDESYHELWKQNKAILSVCKRIFINQGGSDPYGLTTKVLRSIQRLNIKSEIDVVVGMALKTEELYRIRQLKNELTRNYRFHFDLTASKIQCLMQNADMAITAAGNTLYELCALGTPCAVVSHHKDHDVVAREFSNKKASVNIGIGTVLGEDEIAMAIQEVSDNLSLRKNLSENARRLVDGGGAIRIADRMISILSGEAALK